MLLWDIIDNIKNSRYLRALTKDAEPVGTKEEQATLKQLKINKETACRQGDQEEVKSIDAEIKALEEKIRRATTDSTKSYYDDFLIKNTGSVLMIFAPGFSSSAEEIHINGGDVNKAIEEAKQWIDRNKHRFHELTLPYMKDADADMERDFSKYVSEVEEFLSKEIPYADVIRLVRDNMSTIKRYWRDNERVESCAGLLMKWHKES